MCFQFRTDYVWAKAMGYTGAQIPDSDGVSVGKYLLSLAKIYQTKHWNNL